MSRWVLVVDGNLFLRPRIQSDLEGAGWSVAFAASAAAIADRLGPGGDDPPALVLVNLATRGMDPLEVVRAIRTDHPGLPIVGYGPHVDAELLAAGTGAGCTAVVPNGAVAGGAARIAALHAADDRRS